MASNRLTTYVFIFNALMAFLLFLSSQFVLYILNGAVVQDIGIYIDYGFPYTSLDTIYTGVHAPLPNYPLFVFISILIGNAILILLLRRRQNKGTFQK